MKSSINNKLIRIRLTRTAISIIGLAIIYGGWCKYFHDLSKLMDQFRKNLNEDLPKFVEEYNNTHKSKITCDGPVVSRDGLGITVETPYKWVDGEDTVSIQESKECYDYFMNILKNYRM